MKVLLWGLRFLASPESFRLVEFITLKLRGSIVTNLNFEQVFISKHSMLSSPPHCFSCLLSTQTQDSTGVQGHLWSNYGNLSFIPRFTINDRDLFI